jgi:hypothetical protein
MYMKHDKLISSGCGAVPFLLAAPGISHLNTETIDKTLPPPGIGGDKVGCRKA